MIAPRRAVWPISLTEAMVRANREGGKTQTRRPTGRLAAARPGDLLWVREPFHLPAKLDAVSPLQAVQRGYAIVCFAADCVGSPKTLLIGRKRFARELPKVWHRYHLLLDAVRTEPLHAIDLAGAHAEGFASVRDFATAWDTIDPGGKSMKGVPVRWADNPTVDVLTYRFVAAPLPADLPVEAAA